jgi:hypothetical protein
MLVCVDGEQVGWRRERFDGYPCAPAVARDQRRSLLVDWMRAIAEDPQSGVGRMMVGFTGPFRLVMGTSCGR